MRATDSFKIQPYRFVIEFDTGADVGGENSVYIYGPDSEEEALTRRTFYFNTASDSHIRSFAKKFANDAEYRQACISGTVRWARLERWFYKNNLAYWQKWMNESLPDDDIYQRCQRLYKLLDKRLEDLEALPAYKEHLQIENEAPAPSMAQLDSEIAEAVRLFNRIPGVATSYSCQGIRRGARLNEWQHGLIWFPGHHMPLAHIAFSALPPSLAKQLDACLRTSGIGACSAWQAESNAPENNRSFVDEIERFAREAQVGEP